MYYIIQSLKGEFELVDMHSIRERHTSILFGTFSPIVHTRAIANAGEHRDFQEWFHKQTFEKQHIET